MTFDRRKFIKLGGIAAITIAGFSKNSFSFPNEDLLVSQNCQSFKKLVGSQFYFSNNANAFYTTLSKITEFPSLSKKGECFILEFSISVKQAKQDTYNVFHSDLGNFELFVTEGRNGRKRTLLATFNRI